MDSVSVPAARPRPAGPTRMDTQDGILSYYQSEHAGQVYTPPPAIETTTAQRRKMSTASSPSEYSPDAEEQEPAKVFQIPPPTATVAQNRKASEVVRRPSLPSVGGTDRRRLAIVDASSSDHGHGSESTSTTRNNSIRSRRGIERPMDGLALVAPPNASSRAYAELTPPTTAPLVAEKAYSHAASRGISHHKSSSEITTSGTASSNTGHHRRKSSRQVGIIGTSNGHSASCAGITDQSPRHHSADALKPPIFQIPQSRSSSPGATSLSDYSDSHASSSRRGQTLKDEYLSTMSIIAPNPLAVTPNIREGKDIHDPVAASIAVDLVSSPPPTARPHRRSPSPSKLSVRTSSPGAESTSTAASSSGSSYPTPPFSSEATSTYLHYQPGVHATAGPLPPPPRATFNIAPGAAPPPRPPRLNSPPPTGGRRRGDVGSVKQVLQLSDPAASSLNGKTSSSSLSDVRSNSSRSVVSERLETMPRSSPMSTVSEPLPSTTSTMATPRTSDHVREGAFPPSTESSPVLPKRQKGTMDDLVADIGNAIDDVGLLKACDVPPLTVVQPPSPNQDSSSRNGVEIKRDDSWVSITVENVPQVQTPTSDEGGVAMSADDSHGHTNLFRRSTSRSPPKVMTEIGEDVSPSSSPRLLRTTLGASLKRFSSLPRTPSRKSEKRLSAGSRSSNTSSVSTGSTLPPPPPVPSAPRTPPPVQKIISPWPSAMFYSEVLTKKTALERSLGYAAKINELYVHDCGLGEFLMNRRTGGIPARKRAMLMPTGPRGSTSPNLYQPRHVSRSSMESEATFPRRADTTTATDLRYRPAVDTSPPHGPPALPYPSLAQPSPITASPSSVNNSLSSASSTRFVVSPRLGKPSASFFSSLGRKASVRTKDSGSAAPPTKLQKAPAKPVAPNPRPVNIPSAPTVPGGPRAVPNRVSRSQTIMLPKSPPSSVQSHRSNSVNRRPSLFGRRVSPDGSDSAGNIKDDSEFVGQVDKLSDLLPQADRNVLAGYLRRAGSDLNAIGQYLEDEKNGTLRRN